MQNRPWFFAPLIDDFAVSQAKDFHDYLTSVGRTCEEEEKHNPGKGELLDELRTLHTTLQAVETVIAQAKANRFAEASAGIAKIATDLASKLRTLVQSVNEISDACQLFTPWSLIRFLP